MNSNQEGKRFCGCVEKGCFILSYAGYEGLARKGVKMNRNDSGSKIKSILEKSDAIVIGAGAGLSTSAGFAYSGERFENYFWDFKRLYGFSDMYTGGFYPYKTAEEKWAYWSRFVFINRYMNPPKKVYENLLALVKSRNYFVITTNVDHCFQKAGFEKERLFYMQGDYGLFQCSEPCHNKTYNNRESIVNLLEGQGMKIKQGELQTPLESRLIKINENVQFSEIVSRLTCPVCGKPLSMNLRADDTFVQDDGWYEAAKRYENFLSAMPTYNAPVFLELGVGYNTPGIIKYPFWRMTAENPQSTYICINAGETDCPKEIEERSVCINDDIGEIIGRIV